MKLKQRIVPYVVAGALAFAPMTASAGEYNGWNLVKMPFKVAGSVATQVAKGVEGLVTGVVKGHPIDGLATLGKMPRRATLKAVEELGYGLALQDTGKPLEDVGTMNKNLEKYPLAELITDMVAVGAVTGGILELGGGSANAVSQGRLYGAGSEALVSCMDAYLD